MCYFQRRSCTKVKHKGTAVWNPSIRQVSNTGWVREYGAHRLGLQEPVTENKTQDGRALSFRNRGDDLKNKYKNVSQLL